MGTVGWRALKALGDAPSVYSLSSWFRERRLAPQRRLQPGAGVQGPCPRKPALFTRSGPGGSLGQAAGTQGRRKGRARVGQRALSQHVTGEG